jgi:hypothetical protein
MLKEVLGVLLIYVLLLEYLSFIIIFNYIQYILSFIKMNLL